MLAKPVRHGSDGRAAPAPLSASQWGKGAADRTDVTVLTNVNGTGRATSALSQFAPAPSPVATRGGTMASIPVMHDGPGICCRGEHRAAAVCSG